MITVSQLGLKQYTTFTLLLLTVIARADEFDMWSEASPDKKLIAVERRIPDPADPSRFDLDGCTVFICTSKSDVSSDVLSERRIIAQHTFPRRHVSQIGWSPDSKFLLFTTASS